MNFQDFALDARVYAGIPKAFNQATPIQQQAIPAALEGKDVLGIAQTGTGKTAAFVLPMLHILSQKRERSPRALILAPTRELVEQINEAIRELSSKTQLKSCTIYGGTNMYRQIQQLRRGVDIIVACPGRLLDHVNRGTINLDKLEMFVLDEVDQMFDMGFLPDIRRIVETVPEKRQTLLFSATMPPDIEKLANKILVNPVLIKVGEERPVASVSHSLLAVQQNRKNELLISFLKDREVESVLVFTRTKHRADALMKVIGDQGYMCNALHGDLPQSRRRIVLDKFRNGRCKILIATDIAARGIDVNRVSHVINFDMPETFESYTHRIGRTGRAEKKGSAVSFVTQNDSSLLSHLKRRLKDELQWLTMDGFPGADALLRRDDSRASGGSYRRGGSKRNFRAPVAEWKKRGRGRSGGSGRSAGGNSRGRGSSGERGAASFR